MRCKPLAFTSTCAFFLLSASVAFAEPSPSSEDASIGTKPASSPTAATPPPAADRAKGGLDIFDEDRSPNENGDYYRAENTPLATSPPTDWYVLHAGLRPHLGTFGGLATFALAHARTERFYGVFTLSAIRNDAGTHVGALQLGIGRNLSDTFDGGMQLSVSENRARHFNGIGQLGLAYNRTGEMVGAFQLAGYNRARKFAGITQLGLYNRTDESFGGLAEIGLFNHSRGEFNGVVQIGAVSAAGPELFDDASSSKRRFGGIAQIGAVSWVDGSFYGVTQLGIGAATTGEFVGVAQIGALGAGAKKFRGLAQVGVVTMSGDSLGLQIGAAALSFDEHTGLQLGVLGNKARNIDGVQIGVANLARKVRGVQIGVFNHTKNLRGVQIGLANHASDGVLPWTTILNMGFGDEDDGGGYERDDDMRAVKAQASSAAL